jgi:hypothetical protein
VLRENGMFQIAPGAVVLGYVVIALLGASAAVLTGVLISTVLKHRIHGAVVASDALLGALGSVVTVLLCATIPWPSNTETTILGSGVRLETSMGRFQHPYIAAVVVAIILPAFHQLIRSRGARSSLK